MAAVSPVAALYCDRSQFSESASTVVPVASFTAPCDVMTTSAAAANASTATPQNNLNFFTLMRTSTLAFSNQLSAVSVQRSAFSVQLSAISFQQSAFSN